MIQTYCTTTGATDDECKRRGLTSSYPTFLELGGSASVVTSIKSLIDKLNQADSGSINEAELKMDVDKVIDILTTIQKGLKDELK